MLQRYYELVWREWSFGGWIHHKDDRDTWEEAKKDGAIIAGQKQVTVTINLVTIWPEEPAGRVKLRVFDGVKIAREEKEKARELEEKEWEAYVDKREDDFCKRHNITD